MMTTTVLLVLVPCSLIALIVLVIAIRPSASPAVSEVLHALAGVLSTITPWSAKTKMLEPVTAGDDRS